MKLPLPALFLATGVLALAQAPLDGLSMEDLLEVRVQTATLRKQSLRDAPASVTVITAEDIRRYGWRTLGEALSNVRSFYISSDGPLTYTGARGFSLLGDYNTRFLVLVNGHAMTDNVYGAMYKFGQDFPLDLELVEQIEVVRGPSSALYGGNGVFATVNIITLNGASGSSRKLTAQAGSLGEKKIVASTAMRVGSEGNLLLAATALHSGGRHVAFPEGLETDHAGAENGYRFFGNFAWKNWTVMALFGEHKSIVPTGWYTTLVGDTGTTDGEARNFVEASWNRAIGQDASLRWRAYFDQYRYRGVYKYAADYENLDGAYGDWVGSELVYHRSTGDRGTFSVGAQINADLRNVQYNRERTQTQDGPEETDVFHLSHPRTSYGSFVQQEWQVAPNWTVYAGARVDGTTQDRWFVSPRAALIHQRGPTAYKLMYGRAFRNPSTFERYWNPNPALAAERIDTFEAAREQKIRGVNLVASAFHYRLGGLITGVTDSQGEFATRLQYRNTGRTRATGLELEASGRLVEWLDTSASFSWQRTRGSGEGGRLENSPVRLAQLRAAVPLASQRFVLSGAVRYMSSRWGANGDRFPAVVLADATATVARLPHGAELQFGVRNLFDRAFADPLTAEHATQSMPAAGRSAFFRLIWRRD